MMNKDSYNALLDMVEPLVLRSEQLYALSLVIEDAAVNNSSDEHTLEVVQGLVSELSYDHHLLLMRLQTKIMEMRPSET